MKTRRALARAEAKKLYKEQVKGVPKHKRVPFATFFKNYQKLKSRPVKTELPDIPEDFDFDDMIQVNMLGEDEEILDKTEDVIIE